MFAHRGAYNSLREILLCFRRASFCGGLLALFIMANPVFAQYGKPAVAPPSSWVVPLRPEGPFNLQPADPSLDARWVLVERQINAQNDEQFVRRIRQVLTRHGADTASRISINYDPGYQTITLHWIKVWRGTNSLNRLDPGRFQITAPGPDASDFLFNSEKSAMLLLDNLRPGDIIDYAYSLDGANPALNGMFTARVPLQFNEPADRMVTRLVWAPPRKLYIQNHGSAVVPTTVRKTNLVEFTWDSMNVQGLRIQTKTPSWYNPYPWVELSEFQNWSDVNRWAMGLFGTSATNAGISRELLAKISEWKTLPAQDATEAALQFVQRQIRYIGPDSGVSDYQPSMPSVVFARRYGDGKDKTTLLVTILRAMNIDASPVLVSARARQTLTDFHPSPVFFDRAIVRATVNGREYFLDPTAAYESGPLAGRSWLNYSYGLSVAPETTALRVIPSCPVLPTTTESFYFNLGGFDRETTVNIVTVAEGTDAEALRERFATSEPEDIERQYLEAREKDYPDIRSAAHLQFNDDERTNRIQINEFYTIPKIWSHLPDDYHYHCQFYSPDLAEVMTKPLDLVRTQPLAIAYPVHRVSRVEATWAAGLPTHPDNLTINNPAFSFSRMVNILGAKLVIEQEFRSTSDVVTPDAFPTYVRQLNAADELLSTSVVSYSSN
ncbi:MAG TPA: DUF3857 domain-containing protein [Verrucomicrobiae bacterium]|nr:DUF3857 domain-containing protein [Verrucomicrobiae bacterium]